MGGGSVHPVAAAKIKPIENSTKAQKTVGLIKLTRNRPRNQKDQVMTGSPEIVDLGFQVQLAERCLNQIIPICREAGILTNETDAWDEWEELVEQIYCSFVLHPIKSIKCCKFRNGFWSAIAA